jgi:WD40 repeat protein
VSATGSAAYICDARTGGQLVGPLWLEGGDFISAEFCPNGLRVVTSGKTARVWDAQSAVMVSEVKEDDPIFIAHLSANGERLLTVSGGQNRTARVWNATTGRPLTGPISIGWGKTSQFDPSGEWVLSAGIFESARLWSATTGQLLTEPVKHGGLYWGELSQDGGSLVTASREGYARVWGIRIGYQGESSVSLPSPGWAPPLLETLAGKCLNEQSISVSVEPVQPWDLRRQFSASTASDPWTRWGKWLLEGGTPPAVPAR